MNARRREIPPEADAYTIIEMSLRTRIPREELYVACRLGKLKHIKLARKLVIPAFAVEEYLHARTAETMRDLEAAS